MSLLSKNTMRIKLKREILEAKGRFLAITFVVTIGILIYIGAGMSYSSLKTSQSYTYEKLHYADITVDARRIPRFMVEEIKQMKDVSMVNARMRIDMSVIMPDGKKLVGRMMGVPYERPMVDDLLVQEGRYIKPGERNVCMAEQHFADYYKLHPGDKIAYTLKGAEIPMEIVGIVGSPEYLVLAGERGDISPMISVSSMAIIYAPISLAQFIDDNPPNIYNQVVLTVKDKSKINDVALELENKMESAGIKNIIVQDDQIGKVMLDNDLETFKAFAGFFPLLFLGIACFSIYILLSRMVYIQRPFIGVMRATGYTRRSILTHYLSFALIIGAIGAIVGSISGYFVAHGITRMYASTIGIPLVSIKMQWSIIFQGIVLSVLFCALAGVLPAYQSAKVDPAKAMRGEILPTQGRKTLIERILPFLKKAPMFIKVPIRNIFRSRRRTAFTIIGLSFAVMLLMIFTGALDTIHHTIDKSFNDVYRWDMVALILGGNRQATTGKLSRIDGVRGIEPAVAYSCRVKTNGVTSDTVMMGIKPDTNMKFFFSLDNEQLFLRDRFILLSSYFQEKLGLDKGDRVTLETDIRERSFIIGGYYDEPMGNIVYISNKDANYLLGYSMTTRGGYYLKIDPDKRMNVKREIEKIPGLVTTIDIKEIQREIDHYMQLMYIIIYVMMLFGVIMAFALVFNTISINILEREREIATIRTIGTERWKISTMITLENLILGVAAIVPGIIMGYIAGKYVMSLQASEYLHVNFFVFTRTYFIVVALILGILLLSQLPSMKKVNSVDLVEATKQRGG